MASRVSHELQAGMALLVQRNASDMDLHVVYARWPHCPTSGQSKQRPDGAAPVPLQADFAAHLKEVEGPDSHNKPLTAKGESFATPVPFAVGSPGQEPPRGAARLPLAGQFRMYKEDQLLAHPGGAHVDLNRENPWGTPDAAQRPLTTVAKDFKDCLANLGNVLKDLFAGSSYRYVDEAGNIQSAQRKGLFSCLASFTKDVASGLSFGLYRPEGEPEPQGPLERTGYACKKVIKEAFLRDAICGIPSSLLNLVDDHTLALWNLLEVVPAATLGSMPQGMKVVTSLFDNGQVAIDYITDCMPTGEAWMRVHAFNLEQGEAQPPILYNLKLPVHYPQDSRWSTVRNTPLRKSLETIGSLLADIGSAVWAPYMLHSSRRRD